MGNRKCEAIRPPIKNPMTAISDGNWRFERPLIACPDVHPPAYLAPNPIRNPPPTKMIKPGIVVNFSRLNNSRGTKPNPSSVDVGGSIPN